MQMCADMCADMCVRYRDKHWESENKDREKIVWRNQEKYPRITKQKSD